MLPPNRGLSDFLRKKLAFNCYDVGPQICQKYGPAVWGDEEVFEGDY